MSRTVGAEGVTISQTYPTTVEDLWEAVTTEERIPRWFLPVSGDLRLGGRFQLEGNAGGTIEQCDPPRHFRATWEFGGDVSRIDVRVSAEADGHARLEIEHSGITGGEHWLQFGPGAVGIGWDMGLHGLAMHLESGAPVDPEVAANFLTSAEGRALVTSSGEAWYAAHVAAGEDSEQARAAADRTIAAYTA